jgi:nickel/cobalt exporter
MIQQGSASAWIFIPSAVLLGAMHGLEPGHSKTMMAAFIVAIRGTVKQAILLGLAATFSHTLVVWAVALIGLLLFGGKFNAERTEPYFQFVSGILIIAIALWVVWRTRRDERRFKARVADHSHTHEHGADHEHDHGQEEAAEFQDAHERAHANELKAQLSKQTITTRQIILFGFTGGLIPCPASITVLLLCLQLKQGVLGATLVLAFSVGLALTMVVSGVVAAVGMNQATRRWPWVNKLSRRAPYVSSALIIGVGVFTLYTGIKGLWG